MVVLAQDFFETPQGIVKRFSAQGPQRDDSLSGIIDAAFSGFWVHRARHIEKSAIGPLTVQEKSQRLLLVRQSPAKSLVNGDGVGHRSKIAVGGVGHPSVLRIDSWREGTIAPAGGLIELFQACAHFPS